MTAAAFLKSQNKAALALHEDYVRYVELDGDLSSLKLRRKLEVASGGMAIRKDSLSDVGALVPIFENLAGSLGGTFKSPVVLGVPSRDILIRVVELPELNMTDAREALKWDFEKFFPYAYSDAALDIARVDNPVTLEPGKMSVVVAACRLRTMESLMRVASSVGMTLAAIEPLNLAMFRAGLGPVSAYANGYLSVFAEKDITQLVLGYKDNGILYRTSLLEIPLNVEGQRNYGPLVREIANTLTFVKNQYRELVVELVMLGGSFGKDPRLLSELEEATGLKTLTMDVWETWGLPAPEETANGWEAALGLAVRDLL
ncbi:type IV pilus biogenesis protein PilM [Aminivibrio sp.]|uniref:type IV pilus biogenesis protein PilM n=1 Tax=Aminivibrio sp. TaxID=1872489 RepID=UPI003D99545E